MSCYGHMEEQKRKADCDGVVEKCLVKWYYRTCEDCPLYKPKPKIIVKITMPKNSTLEAKESEKE